MVVSCAVNAACIARATHHLYALSGLHVAAFHLTHTRALSGELRSSTFPQRVTTSAACVSTHTSHLVYTRSKAVLACAYPRRCSQALEDRLNELQAEHSDESVPIPKPPFWGGYRVVPTAIEFWHSRPSRLHDRLLFTRDAPGGAWALQRLSP